MISSKLWPNDSYYIGEAAWKTAQKKAPILIGRDVPKEWRKGIKYKAMSIFANELLPITEGCIGPAACIKISKVLGICYLGFDAHQN